MWISKVAGTGVSCAARAYQMRQQRTFARAAAFERMPRARRQQRPQSNLAHLIFRSIPFRELLPVTNLSSVAFVDADNGFRVWRGLLKVGGLVGVTSRG